jgi:hypothetical protein
MEFLTPEALMAGLDHVRLAPRDRGELAAIVRRPAVDERELVAEAQLDCDNGVVGDTWRIRGSKSTPDGSSAVDKQITVMNVRVAELVAGGRERMPLAGDQLYVDFDLSIEHLPAGRVIQVGDVVLEVSESPHLGCAKFVARFGADAMRFVNSAEGRQLRLRGANMRVLTPGTVRVGDPVTAPATPS